MNRFQFVTIRISLALLLVPLAGAAWADTFMDTFSSVSYSNQDGDHNWSSDWVENGDFFSSPYFGDITIQSNSLHLQNDNNSISRSADLTGYTSATLSFDYSAQGFNRSWDSVAVQVRAGNSGSWHTLQTFAGAAVGSGSASYVIDKYIDAVTEIRFETSSDTRMGFNNDFYIDNVLITATTGAVAGSSCAATFPDAVSSNSAGGSIQFGYNSRVTGSPDNILDTTNLVDGSGGVSCDTVACSQSGSALSAISYSSFPGGSNIFVNYAATRTLAPGDYGSITTNSSSTLTLSPGDYTVSGNLAIGYQSKLIVSGAGTARIFVAGTVSFNSQSAINNPGAADQLLIFANGNISLTSPTVLNGFVYSNGAVFTGNGSVVTGAVTGSSVSLESASTVNFDSAALSSTDFGSLCSSPATAPSPMALWHMDETRWTGAAGSVKDSSGSGYDAKAEHGVKTAALSRTTPDSAIVGDPGTCRYGEFDGSNDFITVPSSFPNLTGSFTVTAWIYANDINGDKRIFIDDQNNSGGYGFSLGDGGAGKLRFFSRNINPISVDTQSALISTGGWHFVAAVNDASSKTRRIYVDGNFATLNNGNTSSSYSGTWGSDAGPASIGGETDAASESATRFHFNGMIDEVQVFNGALSQGELDSVYASTHACSATVDHFHISHNGTAIYCTPTPVTVTAQDAANTTYTGYTGTVTLNTNSGIGDWSLSSGSGTLNNGTANDGIATYTFAAADNGVAQFMLDHSDTNTTTPLSINISVTDGSASDDDTEGLLSFAASGFTLTGSALSNPPPNPINADVGNQTAGRNFNVYIAAYGTTPTDPSCGIIESYNGDKNLTLGIDYLDPGSGTIAPTFTASPTTFSAGQAAIQVKYKDVGSIRLTLSDGTLTGSSNPFVVKPARFDIQLSGNPGATDASGGRFITSGTSFPVTVFALDDEGSVTPNYGLEAAPERVALSHVRVAPMAVGAADGALTGSLNLSSPGTFTGNYAWSEVGIINLTADVADKDYLGAGDVSSTLANVGRFYPAAFVLSSGAVSSANAPGTDFTYLGEPFAVQYTLTAVNASGATTVNYINDDADPTKDFAKLKVVDATTGTLSEVSGGTRDIAYGAVGTVSYNSRLTSAINSSGWIAGINTVSVDLAIARATAPEAPISGVDVGVLARDSDGVTLALDLDSDLDTNNDTALIGPLPGELRFGRLIIPPVYGPEIPTSGPGNTESVPFEVQYFNGSAFVRNSDDSHSFYLAHSCSSGSLNCSAVTIQSFPSIAVTAGQSTAANAPTITRPGTPGTINLGLSVDSWLQFDWAGAGSYDQDPQTTITFGSYRGNDRIIYWRER